jgi:hypothetical protein
VASALVSLVALSELAAARISTATAPKEFEEPTGINEIELSLMDQVKRQP